MLNIDSWLVWDDGMIRYWYNFGLEDKYEVVLEDMQAFLESTQKWRIIKAQHNKNKMGEGCIWVWLFPN